MATGHFSEAARAATVRNLRHMLMLMQIPPALF